MLEIKRSYKPGHVETEAEKLVGRLGVNLPPAQSSDDWSYFRRQTPVLSITERETGAAVLMVVTLVRNSPLFEDEKGLKGAWRANCGSNFLEGGNFLTFKTYYGNRRDTLLDPEYLKQAQVAHFGERLVVKAVTPDQLQQKGASVSASSILTASNPKLSMEYRRQAVFIVQGKPHMDHITDVLTISQYPAMDGVQLRQVIIAGGSIFQRACLGKERVNGGTEALKAICEISPNMEPDPVVAFIGGRLQEQFILPTSSPASSQ